MLLVRHGETEWSRSGQHTSRTDLPLLEEGGADAHALARRLRGAVLRAGAREPARARARDTARLAGLASAELTDDLVELGYGDYEGLTTPEIRKERPGWDLWADGSPAGEPLADGGGAGRPRDRPGGGGGRRRRAVRPRPHPAHRGRALARAAAGVRGRRSALDTAALCDLGYERERRVVWLWNDTSHTAADGSAALLVQVLEQVVGGQLDRLVAPLRRRGRRRRSGRCGGGGGSRRRRTRGGPSSRPSHPR